MKYVQSMFVFILPFRCLLQHKKDVSTEAYVRIPDRLKFKAQYSNAEFRSFV